MGAFVLEECWMSLVLMTYRLRGKVEENLGVKIGDIMGRGRVRVVKI